MLAKWHNVYLLAWYVCVYKLQNKDTSLNTAVFQVQSTQYMVIDFIKPRFPFSDSKKNE